MKRAWIQDTDAVKIARYLPSNYRVNPALNTEGETCIEGEDSAGWTMEDYVLPRLGSGLMWANRVEEVT